jgi:hypothetical protein
MEEVPGRKWSKSGTISLGFRGSIKTSQAHLLFALADCTTGSLSDEERIIEPAVALLGDARAATPTTLYGWADHQE